VSNPDDQAPSRSARQVPPTGAPTKKKSVQPKKVPNAGGPPKGKPHVVDPIEAVRTEAPPTPADNRRKNSGSAATTAVIPAMKDDGPRPARPSAPNTRPERAPASSVQPGRRASLRLVHVEPWSVTRLAFVVSVAMMIVSVVAVSIFWIILSVTGVWGQINDSVTSVLSDDGGSFDIKDYLGFGRLFGLTLVLSAINVVLMTALATIGAHLYNLAAQLLGGLEVTFSDD
jgi:hypothetical protein